MGGTAVDRKELYGTIEMLGGFDAVVEKHLWTETARQMRLRLSSSTGSNMKRIYLSYFPFGCPLEPWMTAKPSSSSITSSSRRPTSKSSTARRRSKPQQTIKTMQEEEDEDEDENEDTTTIRHIKKQKEFPRIPAGHIHDHGSIHDHDVTEDFTDTDDERLDHQKDDIIRDLQTELYDAKASSYAFEQELRETCFLLNSTIQSDIDRRVINTQLTQELNDCKQQMVQVLNTIETAMKDSTTMSAFRSAMGSTMQTSLDKQVPSNVIKRPRSVTTIVASSLSASSASSQQVATDPVSKKRKIN
jgi:Cu/Ag efflux pump CusA